MARISGVDLPREKRVEIALTYIFGVGLTTSKKILKSANVDPDIRVKSLTDAQLDDFTLNLSSLLYFVSAAQENLGIKEDVSRAVQKEIYNRVREKAQGTVADKDMAAELQSQNETLTTVIYNRAYKKVKLRAEAASEMVNSVKKVMTRRIADIELSQRDST